MVDLEQEKQWLQQSRDGDHTAFENLIRSYQIVILSVTYRMTGSLADAEDLTQETFIRAFQQLRSFRGESKFSSWLCRVAMNACLNWRQREARRAQVHQQWAGETLPGNSETESGGGQNERSCDVQAALNRLPAKQRAAIILTIYEEMNHAEAARLHWKPPVTGSSGRFWRLAWALTAVTACLLIGFMLGQQRGHREAVAENGLLQSEKMIRETFAMFPNRVKAIVQDERGISLILSDKEDVPASTPLWIEICDGKGCTTMVTFSGQEIELDGKELTVLIDIHGKIILAGDNFVWSNGDALLAGSDNLKIEAKTLASIVL